MRKIRVLLAEDHGGFCHALKSLIELDPSIEVVSTAASGDEVLQRVRDMQPDVICTDIWLPRMNGIEVTMHLMKAVPGAKIIGLSADDDAETIVRFLRAGAMGFVDKMSAAEELHQAIYAVYADSMYLSKGLHHVRDKLATTALV